LWSGIGNIMVENKGLESNVRLPAASAGPSVPISSTYSLAYIRIILSRCNASLEYACPGSVPEAFCTCGSWTCPGIREP